MFRGRSLVIFVLCDYCLFWFTFSFWVNFRIYIFLVHYAFHLDCQFIGKKLHKIFSYTCFCFFHNHGHIDFLIATINYLINIKISISSFLLLLTWLSQILEMSLFLTENSPLRLTVVLKELKRPYTALPFLLSILTLLIFY